MTGVQTCALPICVAERTGYIARVRALARQCAERYIKDRAAMGHPLLNRGAGRDGAKTSRIHSKAVVRRS